MRKRPIGRVELIFDRGKTNRLLAATDDATIDLEERFSEPFSETYWVRFAEPAVDDWFVGSSLSTLKLERGLIGVVRGSEENLYVSNCEKFVFVCHLKPLRENATKAALTALTQRWNSKHELRNTALALIEAYSNWVAGGDDAKLKLATTRYLSLMEKPPAIRGKVDKAFASAFQLIAEDLQKQQFLCFLTYMLIRDLDHELSGKRLRSGNRAWHRELTSLDAAQLEAAHLTLVSALPVAKRQGPISKLVAAKVEGEAALASKRK